MFVTVALAPQMLPLDQHEANEVRTAQERSETLEELALEDLASEAAKRRLEVLAGPELKPLLEAAELLRCLDEHTEALEASGLNRPEEQTSQPEEVHHCSADGWRVVQAPASFNFAPGDRVKLRHISSEDPQGQLATIQALVSLVGEPGELVDVWRIQFDGTDALSYMDFDDEAYVVSVPCVAKPQESTDGTATAETSSSRPGENATGVDESWPGLDSTVLRVVDEGVQPRTWPSCIEPNVATSSADGRGLFVNLGALGLNISSGCFQGDCGHSDHFACESPAFCAKTCGQIRACRRWTFWEKAPSTCWLSGGGPHVLRETIGTVTGSVGCRPEGEASASPKTLFQLLSGFSGTLPPSLWEEWDLVGVLEEFGHMSVDEIRSSWPSTRQRAALRAAARVSRTTSCA